MGFFGQRKNIVVKIKFLTYFQIIWIIFYRVGPIANHQMLHYFRTILRSVPMVYMLNSCQEQRSLHQEKITDEGTISYALATLLVGRSSKWVN